MSEIFFYHLTESQLEETLPILVERSLKRGWRVMIRFASVEYRDAIDALLWTYSPDSFIAHGTDQDKWPEEQPVLLTIGEENLNKASVCFCLETIVPLQADHYERLIFLIDGNDPEKLSQMRNIWKQMLGSGHHLMYYQQTADRRWEKKYETR